MVMAREGVRENYRWESTGVDPQLSVLGDPQLGEKKSLILAGKLVFIWDSRLDRRLSPSS